MNHKNRKELRVTKELRVIASFFVMAVFFVVVVASISHYHILTMYKITENIYEHPLKVSNAALKVQLGVIKIHRDMKDVVLYSSKEELEETIKKVDAQEKYVYKNLKVIEENVLGKEGFLLYEKTYHLFKDWKAIRDMVIELVKSKKLAKAIEITKNRGAIHVRKLEGSSIALNRYANTKADGFKETATTTFENFLFINKIIVLLIVILLLGSFTYIYKRIKKYISLIAQSEEKMSKISLLLNNTLNSFNSLIFAKDKAFKYIECNHAFAAFVGRSREEILGSDDYALFDKDLADLFRAKDKEMLELGDVKHNYEWVRYPDGSDVYLLTIKSPLRDDKENIIGIVGNSIDMTHQKSLQDELKKQEEIMIAQSRHAAMGEMISMIAHQWRQPISVISMDANNILADIELEMLNAEELASVSKDIIAQTQELSQTIDDFREFFKPDKNPEESCLQNVVENTLGVIGKSLENNGISLSVQKDVKVKIKTFARELMQVLINIIKNAKEVLIERESEKKSISIYFEKKEDEAIISISDSAGGIEQEIIEKIFDPYFTTKGEKNGTGLGLYMSKTIVEKHLKGSIRVFNAKDGATFEIRLPLSIDSSELGEDDVLCK